jgi:SAM-dependent methyltransferase
MNSEKQKKLNLGCAGFKKPGYINVDWQSIVVPDVSHNLNEYPYPFADNEFDLVEAFHCIEHLDRPFLVMTELHRILKPGGTLLIKVPHFSRGMTHPEHFHGFDVTLPNYFDSRYKEVGYFGVDFELRSLKMKWNAFPHILKSMGYGRVALFLIEVLDAIINFFANLNVNIASRIWCFWVGGFDEIFFEFKCKK